MDDLDDDLFNSLLSSRPKSRSKEQSASSIRPPPNVIKALQSDEVEEDDLPDLGLTEEGLQGGKKEVVATVENDFDFGNYIPSSAISRRPRTTPRRGNAETDIFAGSGAAEIKDERENPSDGKTSDDWLGIFGSKREPSTEKEEKKSLGWPPPPDAPVTSTRIEEPVEETRKTIGSPLKQAVLTSTRPTQPHIQKDANPGHEEKSFDEMIGYLQRTHERELQELTSCQERHARMMEESYGRREARLRTELSDLYEELSRQRRRWAEEREELQNSWGKKMKAAEAANARQVEEVTELHREALSEVKRQLTRYQAELENVAPFTRSLNGLVQQMEKAVLDLGTVASPLRNNQNSQNHHEQTNISDSAKLREDLEETRKHLRTERLKLDRDRETFEEDKARRTAKSGPEIGELERSLRREREDLRDERTTLKRESEKTETLRLNLERKGRDLEKERSRLDEWARALRELAAEVQRSQQESFKMRQNGVVALNSAKELWGEFCARSKALGHRETQHMQRAELLKLVAMTIEILGYISIWYSSAGLPWRIC